MSINGDSIETNILIRLILFVRPIRTLVYQTEKHLVHYRGISQDTVALSETIVLKEIASFSYKMYAVRSTCRPNIPGTYLRYNWSI